MIRKRRISIEAKITILVVGTLLAVLFGVGHIVLTAQSDVLYNAKMQQYESVAQTLALSAEPLVHKKSSDLAVMIRERLRQSQWEMKYVSVADERGRLLFNVSQKLPPAYHSNDKNWQAVRKFFGYGGLNVDSIHPVIVPFRINGNHTGTVTVGFSLVKLQEMLYSLQSCVLLTLAVAMLIGSLCALLFARTIATALRSLIHGARAVARGDFSFRVQRSTTDEVGELADAYNYMLEALKRSHDQLIEKANADGLTGLHNHRRFQERFAEEFSRAARYERPISVMMLDIDKFKAFNDQHGHPMGDAVLTDMAGILVETLRQSDFPARYGGEEFVAILPETGEEEAIVIAERLRKAVEKHQFIGRNDEIVPVTVSIGVASFPNHATEKSQLLKAADNALYRAKAEGRNCVRFHSNESVPATIADPCRLYVLLNANDLLTIEAFAEAVDAKHRFPSGHSASLASMAAEVASKVGMDESDTTGVYLAALMRDIGQIAIPDAVLSKQYPLNDEEQELIKQHPVLGHAIIQKSSHLQSVLPGILHHHERYNGTGYPYGLSGKDIPLSARIIAVVDAYQSMLTDRPHRPSMTPGEAQIELAKGAGTQFDPEIVDLFTEILATRQHAA